LVVVANQRTGSPTNEETDARRSASQRRGHGLGRASEGELVLPARRGDEVVATREALDTFLAVHVSAAARATSPSRRAAGRSVCSTCCERNSARSASTEPSPGASGPSPTPRRKTNSTARGGSPAGVARAQSRGSGLGAASPVRSDTLSFPAWQRGFAPEIVGAELNPHRCHTDELWFGADRWLDRERAGSSCEHREALFPCRAAWQNGGVKRVAPRRPPADHDWRGRVQGQPYSSGRAPVRQEGQLLNQSCGP